MKILQYAVKHGTRVVKVCVKSCSNFYLEANFDIQRSFRFYRFFLYVHIVGISSSVVESATCK